MTSCCRVRNYESINDEEMVAPSKVSKYCGRTFKWMKEKNAFTRVAFLAFAMLAAGYASSLSYNPLEDPIEHDHLLYPFSLSAVGAGIVFSFVSEGLFCCIPLKGGRRLPSPCVTAFWMIAAASVAVFVERGETSKIIHHYEENRSKVFAAEGALYNACTDMIFADPRAFTNPSCGICEMNLVTWIPKLVWYSQEIFQLQQIPVDFDICFYNNGDPQGLKWDQLGSIVTNTSWADNYPCDISFPTTNTMTPGEIFDVLNFLSKQYGLHVPMIINTTVVNTTEGDLIGCKNLYGFANRQFPLTLLCNLSQYPSLPLPLDMSCQSANFTAYFNEYDKNYTQIKTFALSKPQRAYQVYQRDPVKGWGIASGVSGLIALVYVVGEEVLLRI